MLIISNTFSRSRALLSEIRFLNCFVDDNNQSSLESLAKISKSIKTLEFHIMSNNNSGIIKLIKAQKNLNDVKFNYTKDVVFHKTLEESLIKHAGTIQYLQILDTFYGNSFISYKFNKLGY